MFKRVKTRNYKRIRKKYEPEFQNSSLWPPLWFKLEDINKDQKPEKTDIIQEFRNFAL